MRIAVVSLALFSMTLATLGYLGCTALLTDAPVNEPGFTSTYDVNGFLGRTRCGQNEIFLPRGAVGDWFPLVPHTSSPEVSRVPSPMKADAPQIAVLHANDAVTLEPR